MKRGVRFVAALLSVGAILWWVGPEVLLDALSKVTFFAALQLGVLSFLLILVSCIKWRLFIREGGNDATLLELMEYYLIGYFFNLFTPSFIGGDVARSYQLGTRLGSQKQALVSTFLERFTGLLAMTLLGVGAVALGTEVTKGLEISILLFAVAAAGLAALCFSRSLRIVAQKIIDRITLFLGERPVSTLIRSLAGRFLSVAGSAQTHPRLLVRALGWSFVYHLLTVGNAYVAGLAVGWESPPVGGLFIVVPIALLVGMIPLTPSGIGVQEGAFLYLLQRIGASEGEGLGVGVVLRVKVVILGLLGGLLFFSRRSRR